jgi:gliding-associated putative ABC transporter substrate-binding component GldG
LAALNFISSRRFLRFDLTSGNMYTLSKSSRDLVGSLDDLLNITVYFSKKLPPNLLTLQNEVKDMLDEFRAYSRGRVRVEWIDPLGDEKTALKVRGLGIPMVQMNVIERDKAEVINGYLGLAVSYRDNTEVIPIVRDVANLEYDIDSRILKVSQKEIRTVAVMTTGGGYTLSSDMRLLSEALGEQYRVEEISPATQNRMRPEVNTLVVAGVKELSQLDLYNIDQFIMRGGRVLFLADAVDIGQGLTAAPVESEAFDMLASYGVYVGQNLVLDRSNETASFSSGFFSFFLPYPFFVKVVAQGLDETNPIVSKLESLVLPWTSTVETADVSPRVSATILARSTKSAFTMSERFVLDPQQKYQRPDGPEEELPLAVLLDGPFDSYFRENAVPEESGGGVLSFPEKVPEGTPTQIIIVGNSRFATDAFARQFPQGRVFLQNAVDWLTMGDYLISVRSKSIVDRPLRELSERGRTTYKVLNTYLVPFLVAFAGLLHLYVRHRKRS